MKLNNALQQTDALLGIILQSTLKTFLLRVVSEWPRTDITVQTIRCQRAMPVVIIAGHLPEILKYTHSSSYPRRN